MKTKCLAVLIFFFMTYVLSSQNFKHAGESGKHQAVPVNMDLNFIPIGESGNAYGFKGNPKTYLWSEPDINTVVFTHRMANDPETGGVDRIAYDVSFDRGKTGSWTTDIQVYDPAPIPGSYYYVAARYPQGLICNPEVNTDPGNAYYVYFASVLDGSNEVWGGYGYGVNKLNNIDPPEPTQHNEKTSEGQTWRYIPNAFTINKDGALWMVDISFDAMEAYYTGNLIINEGVFDSDSNDVIYTEWLQPALAEGDSIIDVKIAFSPDGQTGYICLLARPENNNVPFTFFHPVIYCTDNGGEAWSEQAIHCQLGGPQGLEEVKMFVPDSLLPSPNTNRDSVYYTMERNFDLIVDKYGKAHILGLVSLTDETGIWEPARFSMGTFHLIYDMAADNWDAQHIFYNYSYDGDLGGIIHDNRPQISRDVAGENLFFTWLDSDLEEVSDNLSPDIYSVAFDVIEQEYTDVYNITSYTNAMWQAYYGCQPEYVFIEEIPGETRYYLPLAYEELNPEDPLSPVQFWYIDGFYYTKYQMGVEENNENEMVIMQNIPNPFNEYTIIKINSPVESNLNFQIRDISGQLVFEKMITKKKNTIKLSAGDFSPGCYFYSVVSDKGVITRKMIVE